MLLIKFIVCIFQKVRFWKKVYVIYSFFFVRKIIAHMVTFSFYCVVLPLTILVPEVKVPIWGAVYIPSVITILNSVGTPRYGHFFKILLTHLKFSSKNQDSTNKLNAQVNSLVVLLDPFRKCYVFAPD